MLGVYDRIIKKGRKGGKEGKGEKGGKERKKKRGEGREKRMGAETKKWCFLPTRGHNGSVAWVAPSCHNSSAPAGLKGKLLCSAAGGSSEPEIAFDF